MKPNNKQGLFNGLAMNFGIPTKMHWGNYHLSQKDEFWDLFDILGKGGHGVFKFFRMIFYYFAYLVYRGHFPVAMSCTVAISLLGKQLLKSSSHFIIYLSYLCIPWP